MPDKVTLLLLAANPSDTGRLALDEELRTIHERIRTAEFRDALEIKDALAARRDDLLAALNEYKPTIVHFSGHGESEGITMSGEDGASVEVSGELLKEIFRSAGDSVRLVVLNACASLDQAKAIVEVVDCAVGSRGALPDGGAATFAGAFYRALAYGKSVGNAFEQGRAALNLEERAEVPTLLARKGIDPGELVLVQPPADEVVEESTSEKKSEPEKKPEKNALDRVPRAAIAAAGVLALGLLGYFLWPEGEDPQQTSASGGGTLVGKVIVQTQSGRRLNGAKITRAGSGDTCVTQLGECQLALSNVTAGESMNLGAALDGYRLASRDPVTTDELQAGVTLIMQPTRVRIIVSRDGERVAGASVEVRGPPNSELHNAACREVRNRGDRCLVDTSNVNGSVFFFFEPPLKEIRVTASVGLVSRTERFRLEDPPEVELQLPTAVAVEPSARPGEIVRIPVKGHPPRHLEPKAPRPDIKPVF